MIQSSPNKRFQGTTNRAFARSVAPEARRSAQEEKRNSMFVRVTFFQIVVCFIFGCGNAKLETNIGTPSNSQPVSEKQHIDVEHYGDTIKMVNSRSNDDLCEEVKCSLIDCVFEFSQVDNIAFCPDWIREENPQVINKIDWISEGCVETESESTFDKTVFVYPTTCPSLTEISELCGKEKVSAACCEPVFKRGVFKRYGKERDGKCFVLDSWGNTFNETMVKQFREPSLIFSEDSNIESYRLIGSSFGANFSIRIEKNDNGVFLIRKLSPYVFRKEGEESITYTIVSNSQWDSFKKLLKNATPKNLEKIRVREVKDGQTEIFEFLDSDGYVVLLRGNYMEPELAKIENYFYYLAGVLPDTRRCAEQALPGDN